jgi:hypothetical protein
MKISDPHRHRATRAPLTLRAALASCAPHGTRALAVCVLAAAAACVPAWHAVAPAALAPEGFSRAGEPAGFLLRQRIAFETGARAGSFEAAVQSRCGELTIVGLAPFGARAFTLRDRTSGVEIERHLPIDWPFPPDYIVRDVRRTLFVPLPDAAPPSGTRTIEWRGESVDEVWSDGRLVERSFPEGDSARERVRYAGGLAPGDVPTTVDITSERHGYRLRVVTLSRVALRCDP